MACDEWTMKKLFGSNTDAKMVDPEFTQYMQVLSSLPAEKLASEPYRLNVEKLSLQEETENLAFSHYKTFIQAANCSKEIYDDFTLIENHLDTMTDLLPGLDSDCRSFLQQAQTISGRRAADSLALDKHAQLLQFLEIPQMMDTCVRAGHWEEALQLSQYVPKLERRLSHISVVTTVSDQVTTQRSALLNQLLEQLHTSLSLPQCLKVIGFLRRLTVFNEAELRIKFLLSRGSWLRSLSSSSSVLNVTDPCEHANRLIESTRVHLFDVITQYKAVFPDDDSFQTDVHLPAILHDWIHDKVTSLLNDLEMDLRRVEHHKRLDSLLTQTMYLGLSLGRVGADFRSLVAPLFEGAISDRFRTQIDSATKRLMEEMQGDFLASIHANRRNEEKTEMDEEAEERALWPPMTLMNWSSLAVFCNEILIAFNSMKMCLPLTLAPSVVQILQHSLSTIVSQLAVVASKHLNESNESRFRTSCTLLIHELTPFLNRCLDTLFPFKQMASFVGLGLGQTSQLKRLRIDMDDIGHPIDGYLPRKVSFQWDLVETIGEPPSAKEDGHAYSSNSEG